LSASGNTAGVLLVSPAQQEAYRPPEIPNAEMISWVTALPASSWGLARSDTSYAPRAGMRRRAVQRSPSSQADQSHLYLWIDVDPIVPG
jgi:hypothetical protein